MHKKKSFLYVLTGLLMLLVAGFVYAWSILSGPLSAEFPAWTNTQLSFAFTLCIICFCLGGMLAGVLSRRYSIRLNICLSAGLIFCGCLLLSKVHSLAVLYLGFGLCCGLGAGFSYNSVLSSIPKIFPDNYGVISGILLMGFGFSSMLCGSVYSSVENWRSFFVVYGAAAALILVAASFVLGSAPPAKQAVQGTGMPANEMRPAQMLRKSNFWFFYFWAVTVTAAGLVIQAQARPISLLVDGQMSATKVSLVVGYISICNGLGRVVFGALFDRFGRRLCTAMLSLVFLIALILLPLSCRIHSQPLLVVCFMMVGFAYGGTPSMCAAVTKLYFGQTCYPQNYAVITTNMLPASLCATAAGAFLDRLGSFRPVFIFIILLVTCALLLQFLLKDPTDLSKV